MESTCASNALQFVRRCKDQLSPRANALGVELWLQPYGPARVGLESIWSLRSRGTGHASAVLKELCEMADSERMQLELTVSPMQYGGGLDGEDEDCNGHFDGQALDVRQLEAWYSRYGFTRRLNTDPDSPTLFREPRH